MLNYKDMSDEQKKIIIKKLYETENKSFLDIAKELNTYANKIRRDAIKFNLKIRDKSQAQKNALITGKHKHPTKGTKRSQQTKSKIGKSVMQSWDGLTESELDARKLVAKNNWNNLSDDQKKYMQQKANVAVRQSSKVGSKLENYLLDKLIQHGYRVNFHQEQTLSNTKLQIDLFLPSMNVAIEVDGPSHFLPVWGDDVLQKNKNYDQKKEGLILGKGSALIRIKQTKDFSKSRADSTFDKLIEILDSIKNKFPEPGHRLFNIED